jgi:polygalacturonase
VGHSVYAIDEYGAKASEGFLNTAAIQAAIDAAYAAGGGQVLVPPGRFLTGGIMLKDHVELHLARGAVLLGSIDKKDYPRWIIDEHAFSAKGGPAAPLFAVVMAERATNIAVTGHGTIFGNGGQGEDFRAYPVSEDGHIWHKPPRPNAIHFYYCRHILEAVS